MMENVVIRVCRAEDLPAVRDLLCQLDEVAHNQSDFEPARLAALLEHMAAAPQFYHNLVAEAEGRVVGFISVIFYKTHFHRGGTALINELVVDRAVRGTGIGRALVERAISEAQNRGMDEVEVGTEQDNLAAQAFYHKCGFDEEYLLLGLEFAV
jgi:GNAT superfamily N-acetyltransferase